MTLGESLRDSTQAYAPENSYQKTFPLPISPRKNEQEENAVISIRIETVRKEAKSGDATLTGNEPRWRPHCRHSDSGGPMRVFPPFQLLFFIRG